MVDISAHIINARNILREISDLISPAGNMDAHALFNKAIELQSEAISMLKFSDILQNKEPK